MMINIFNVEHGFCSLIVADNRNIVLIDCGINNSTGFKPSDFLHALSVQNIQYLIISNFDEDHVSDIANIWDHFRPNILVRNKSITSNELEQLKLQSTDSGVLSHPLEIMLDMHSRYVHDVVNYPDLSGITLKHFCNDFSLFDDTNNISLVTFLEYDDFSMIFPGDIEKEGWHALLDKPEFVRYLQRVNVFVTSHHGRESGYCTDVFNYCHPDIFITSDDKKQYQSQEIDYLPHAKGLVIHNGKLRHELTTRKDGRILIHKSGNSPYTVHTEKN